MWVLRLVEAGREGALLGAKPAKPANLGCYWEALLKILLGVINKTTWDYYFFLSETGIGIFLIKVIQVSHN